MSVQFNQETNQHFFTAPNGKLYSSVNKSYINTKYEELFNRVSEAVSPLNPVAAVTAQQIRSDEEIADDIKMRFDTMDMMVQACLSGLNRAMIISSIPGIGKSHGVMKALEASTAKFTIIKGHITPLSLYSTLYSNRNKNRIVVFDDCDEVFEKETMMNIIKAACDTTPERQISWLSSKEAYDEDGDILPSSFTFEGSIIFITNKDFDAEISRGNSMSTHYDAMRSRAHYVDLGVKSVRDRIIRISQVLEQKHGRNCEKTETILSFIKKNQDRMVDLSLRLINKIEDLMVISPTNWEKTATVTLMKGR